MTETMRAVVVDAPGTPTTPAVSRRPVPAAPGVEVDFLRAGHLLGSAYARVRFNGDQRTVIDGPFAETREQLGGYYLVDAKDLDEALNIAARIPVARVGTIEVRPVMEIGGLPSVKKGEKTV